MTQCFFLLHAIALATTFVIDFSYIVLIYFILFLGDLFRELEPLRRERLFFFFLSHYWPFDRGQSVVSVLYSSEMREDAVSRRLQLCGSTFIFALK